MLARFVQFAIVVLALVIGTQAKAQTIYGTYYDDEASTSCSGVSNCRLNFSQIPADKLLMLSKINCNITTATQLTALNFLISATLGGSNLARSFPMALPAPALAGGINFYNFREDAHFLVGQSRFPFLVVGMNTTASISMFCTLVGDLVTPIQ
jgi:hypothetical protein